MSNVRMTPRGEVVRKVAAVQTLAAALFLVGCGATEVVSLVDESPAELTITLVAEEAGTLALLDLEVGETATLAATTLNTLGQPVGSALVSWSSTNPEVASVASDGEVTALGEGTADIVASANNVFDVLPIQVTAPPEPPSGS